MDLKQHSATLLFLPCAPHFFHALLSVINLSHWSDQPEALEEEYWVLPYLIHGRIFRSVTRGGLGIVQLQSGKAEISRSGFVIWGCSSYRFDWQIMKSFSKLYETGASH
jgi:hypothetical protein